MTSLLRSGLVFFLHTSVTGVRVDFTLEFEVTGLVIADDDTFGGLAVVDTASSQLTAAMIDSSSSGFLGTFQTAAANFSINASSLAVDVNATVASLDNMDNNIQVTEEIVTFGGDSSSDDDTELSAGAIAGIVLAVIAVTVAAMLVSYKVFNNNNNHKRTDAALEQPLSYEMYHSSTDSGARMNEKNVESVKSALHSVLPTPTYEVDAEMA